MGASTRRELIGRIYGFPKANRSHFYYSGFRVDARGTGKALPSWTGMFGRNKGMLTCFAADIPHLALVGHPELIRERGLVRTICENWEGYPQVNLAQMREWMVGISLTGLRTVAGGRL